MIYKNLTELIGGIPLVELKKRADYPKTDGQP